MKKIFGLTLIAIFALGFWSCADITGDTRVKTTLTIINMSGYDIYDVHFASANFGKIESGREKTEEVTADIRYIFFSLMILGESIPLRTADLCRSEEGKNTVFDFLDTSRVALVNGGNTDIIKNIVEQLNGRKPLPLRSLLPATPS